MDFSGQTRKRKVDQSTRVTLNREELLLQHSQEMIQMEQRKAQEKSTRLIQRWYRGRRAAAKVKQAYRAIVTKRVSDLQKLEKVLKANYVVALDKVLPELVRLFIFSYSPRQPELLSSICHLLLIMFRSLPHRVSPFFQDATIVSSRGRLIFQLGSLCEYTATTRDLGSEPYEFCTLVLDPQAWVNSIHSLDPVFTMHMCDRILQLASGSKSFFSYLIRNLKDSRTEIRPRDFKTGQNLFPVSTKQPWYQYAWTLWGRKCMETSHLEFLWKNVMPIKHAFVRMPPELIRHLINAQNFPTFHSFISSKISELQSQSDKELSQRLTKQPDFLYNLTLLLYFFAITPSRVEVGLFVRLLTRLFTILKRAHRIVLKTSDSLELRGFQVASSPQSDLIDEPPSLGVFDLEEDHDELDSDAPLLPSTATTIDGLPVALVESYEVLQTSSVIKLLTEVCDLMPLCHIYCDIYMTRVVTSRKNVDELLCKLVYNTTFIRKMYAVFEMVVSARQNFDVDGVIESLKEYIGLLTLFAGCLSQLLLVIDDNEFHSEQVSDTRLSLAETRHLTLFFNYLGYKLCLSNLITSSYQSHGVLLFLNVENVLTQLYNRYCRRPYVDRRVWEICDISAQRLLHYLQNPSSRYSLMLERMPHLFPFEIRATIFHYLVLGLKTASYQQLERFISIPIRREHIVEDAIEELRYLAGSDLITAARITFIGPGMVAEMGVDAGGLFKEFLTNFAKVAFDPSSNYFIEADKRALIPNPRFILERPSHSYVYEVMGMIIGKAIIEEVLLQPNFSRIFLNKLLNKPCYFSDLKELDLQYATSLEMVKNYQGDFEDLGLWFSTTEEVAGRTVSIPLEPNGERVPVTRNNVMRYIKAMTNYKLNLQIQSQCEAFLQGLNKVLPLQYLSIFNQDELQLMISGNMQGFDVADLQANVQFTGYDADHKAVKNLWRYLGELKDEDRSKFLQFCTGCSRAPLLGFKFLTPKFTVEKGADTNMLPTASTCTNTFRLPPFMNYSTLKEKLDLAINSNAGFGFG